MELHDLLPLSQVLLAKQAWSLLNNVGSFNCKTNTLSYQILCMLFEFRAEVRYNIKLKYNIIFQSSVFFFLIQ